MNTELANVESDDAQSVSLVRVDARSMLMSMPVDKMASALSEYDDRRKLFREWLMSKLTRGVHYGFSPGCEPKLNANGDLISWDGKAISKQSWVAKPSLYKAGAEFIADLLNLLPVYSADKDTWEMLGAEKGVVVMRCQLYPKGAAWIPENLVGEGIGCRKVGEKKGNENNAVKMAQKSAMVCATLNSYGLSDLFTQDTEDGNIGPEPARNPSARPEPKVPPRGKREQSSNPINGPGIINERFQSIKARWKAACEADGDQPTPDSWRSWVVAKIGLPPAAALKPDMWNNESLRTAEEAMNRLEGKAPY